MDIANFVGMLGGVVHQADLLAAGATRREVQAAMARRKVIRVRRDWIATAECDPALLRAVRIGGRLSCVSAAQQRNLWVIDDHRFHVAAHPTSGRLRTAPETSERARPVIVHWSRAPVPVTTRVAVDPIENMLVQIARCQPHEAAVVAMDSALNKRLVSRAQLIRLAGVVGGAFQDVVSDSDARAESGLESLPRVRLARLGIRMLPQASIDGHRIDGMIGERLLLQFDGDTFHSKAPDRHRDRREDARLVLQGYTMLRYGTPDVLDNWAATQAEILSAMAQELHRWPASQRLRPAPQEILRIAGRPSPP